VGVYDLCRSIIDCAGVCEILTEMEEQGHPEDPEQPSDWIDRNISDGTA
jgi:hypothetical protein